MGDIKFKKGDRVIVTSHTDGFYGFVGTVVGIRESYVVVELDREDYRLLYFDGLTKRYHGWCFLPSELKLTNEHEDILIYGNGRTVTALFKASRKFATATCSPDDEFDFRIGAKLALERLLEPEKVVYKKPEIIEEPKPLNARFCVVKGDEVFKTGHIYEIADGVLRDPTLDLTDDCILVRNIFTFDRVKEYFSMEWSLEELEVIEVFN